MFFRLARKLVIALKAKFAYGSNFQSSFRHSFKSAKLQAQLKNTSILAIGLVLTILASPLLTKTFQPKLANAAPPTIQSIFPNIGQTSGGDKVIIRGKDFGSDAVFTHVSTGANHTCALDSSGKAYCWGADHRGQLGDGGVIGSSDFKTTPSPVVMPSGVAFTQLDSGQEHSCAITSDQQVYCWGHGEYGQLGNNSTDDQSSPVLVNLPAGSKATQISAGLVGSCALLTTGQAYCWGWNAYGQVGDGTSGNNRLTPVLVNLPSGATHYLGISLGQSSTCAIGSDGNVYCWGSNSYGQLGDGTTTSVRITPARIAQGSIPAGVTFSSLRSSYVYSHYALGSNGRVYAWGYGSFGALGNGGTVDSNVPVAVSQGAIPADINLTSPLGAGARFACGLGTNSKAYCWGQGEYGRLGNGSTADSSIPVAVSMPTGVLFNQISSSGAHACAIGSNHKTYCWGANGFGQLGIGDTTNSSAPVIVNATALPKVQVSFGGVPATSVRHRSRYELEVAVPAHAAGAVNIVVTNPDNTSATLASGYRYENPTTPQITSVSPNQGLISGGEEVTIAGTNLDNFKWKYLGAGGSAFNCAIGLDNKAYCWGHNASGQLGIGNTTRSIIPVAVKANQSTDALYGKTMVQISAGHAHACALDSAGQAYCWGFNSHGQLGNGTMGTFDSNPIADSHVPTAVIMPAGVTFRQIAAGTNKTCALSLDDQVYCWGSALFGQLGNGTYQVIQSSSVPVKALRGEIPLGVSISKLVVGYHYTCILGSNNRAYCWGHNAYGQLGDGTTDNRVIPTAVSMPAGVGFTKIVTTGAYSNHTCAIGTNDKVYCWGYNNYGQLGIGNTNNQSIPALVSLPSGVISADLATGYCHTCAIGTNNQIYCWGRNHFGQLGNGTNTSSLIPVVSLQGAIPSNVSSMQIRVTNDATCMFGSNHKIYCWGDNYSGQHGNGTRNHSSVPVATQTANYVVTFNPVTTSEVTPITNTEVKVITPIHTVGPKSLFLTNATSSQTTNNLTFTFVNPPVPTATSISSSSGLIYGGEEITVAGTNLDNFGWRQVATGAWHSCGIALDNKTYCWGRFSGNVRSTPIALAQGDMPAGVFFRQIAIGDNHSCGIGSDGWTYCWGNNAYGKLGDGTEEYRAAPTTVSQGQISTGASLTSISVGQYHTCVLDSAGKAYCWGLNNYGQLGDNGASGTSKPTPVAVSQGSVILKQISAGSYHTCALDSDDRAYCWGGNNYGQLGDGTPSASSIPVVVKANDPADALYGKIMAHIAAGHRHTCALDSTGKAYCWGGNNHGQLGNNSTSDSSVPVLVAQGDMASGETFSKMTTNSANGYSACGVSSSQKTYCWGWNEYNQLGNGSEDSKLVPTLISQGSIPSSVNLTQISTSWYHTCALGSNRRAYCWGRNTYGQLGNGLSGNELETQNSSIPVSVLTANYIINFGNVSTRQITSLTDTEIKVIAPAHQLGAKDWSLVHTTLGQTVDTRTYTYTNPPVPTVAVSTPNQGPIAGNTSVTVKATNLSNLKVGNNWKQVAPGNSHTCAISLDNQTYCWGNNAHGQLGNGATVDSLIPKLLLKAKFQAVFLLLRCRLTLMALLVAWVLTAGSTAGALIIGVNSVMV